MEVDKLTDVPVVPLTLCPEHRLPGDLSLTRARARANSLNACEFANAAEPVVEALPPPPKSVEALPPPPMLGRGRRRSWAHDGAEAEWYAASEQAKTHGAFTKSSYLNAFKSHTDKFKGGNQARQQRRLRKAGRTVVVAEAVVAEAVAAVAVPAAAPAVTSLSSLCLQKEEALLKKVVDCPRTDVGVAGVAAVLQLAEQELAEKDSTLSLMLTDEAHLLVGCHAMKASNMYVPTFGPGTCSTHTEAHATHTHTHRTQCMAGASTWTNPWRSMTEMAAHCGW